MVVVGNKFLLILSSFYLFHKSASFLDIEELNNIQYGISIINTPVLMAHDNSEGIVLLASKYGQQYQCQFPDKNEQEKKESEEEKQAEEIGIKELLRPMEDSPCLLKQKDWWTYEFCYRRSIKQYHMEDNKPVGNILNLGVYESEFNWDDAQLQEMKSHNQLNRYHSQNYVNGTNCELNGNPRRSEVRFICETGSGDYIARIDEPESCVYIVTIHTMKICHHPFLKPRIRRKPLPITCYPVLNEEQYEEYISEREAMQKGKEKYYDEKSQLTAELNNIQTVNHKNNVGDDLSQDTSEESDKLAEGANEQLRKVLKSTLKEMLTGFTEQEMNELVENADLNVNVVNDVQDINKLLDDLKDTDSKVKIEDKEDGTQSKKLTDSTNTADTKIGADADHSTYPNRENSDKKETLESLTKTLGKQFNEYENEEQKGEDSELSITTDDDDREFDEGLDKLVTEGNIKSQLSNIREKLHNRMTQQFDDILDEAQQELEEEGLDMEHVDKEEHFKQMASTLNTMMQKLEETEKEIENVGNELESKTIKSSEHETVPKDSQSPTALHGQKNELDQSKSSILDDDRVKVRVVKLRDGLHNSRAESESEKKFANTVKQELEKAGLDTDGKKIEVKIITTGYYDSDDDSIHILSDEETQSFNRLMLGILGGNQEALREAERHQQLENAYNYNFHNKRKIANSQYIQNSHSASAEENGEKIEENADEEVIVDGR